MEIVLLTIIIYLVDRVKYTFCSAINIILFSGTWS